MNEFDVWTTSRVILTLGVIPLILIAGFITPLQYNYHPIING